MRELVTGSGSLRGGSKVLVVEEGAVVTEVGVLKMKGSELKNLLQVLPQRAEPEPRTLRSRFHLSAA